MAAEIDDLDFNTLRNKIIEVIGNGAGTYGYGQAIQSSQVFQGNIIRKTQWDGLRNDLLNILIHQNGITPSLIEVARGSVIGEDAGDPLQVYLRAIDTARFNRFLLAPGQSLVTAVSTKTYTSSWSSSASMTVQLTFGSADNARFFFNSGGKIRFISTRTGGSSTAQNNAWTNVLLSTGVIDFGADSDFLDFYTLTNTYQTRIASVLSTPYSANNYKIEALCNVANNSTGTATSVTFRITWTDAYVDPGPSVSPPDVVNGTLSLSIEEVKASGNLQPSGSFSITSPSYTISNITAS
jgi:hypothetical protein